MYQSACSAASANVLYLGCYQHHSANNSAVLYYPTTNPTPVPTNGNGTSIGGPCDCTTTCSVFCNPAASGSVWNSAFNGGEEYWKNPTGSIDMLTIQGFAAGSSQPYNNCFNYGFKNVAARRQWHGTYGWLSNDACTNTSSIAPDQTKYLNCSIAGSLASNTVDLTYGTTTTNASVSGTVSVGANTGLISSGLTSTEDDYYTPVSGSMVHTLHSVNGAGYTITGVTTTSYASGLGTSMDIFPDVHCTGSTWAQSVQAKVGAWNSLATSLVAGGGGLVYPPIVQFLPGISNNFVYGPYSANIVQYDQTSGSVIYSSSLSCNISGSNTSFTEGWSYVLDNWNILYTGAQGTMQTAVNSSYSLTMGLSNKQLSTTVQTDCANALLSTWNLADNAVYPYRTDEYTSIMPLVTRREVQNNIMPTGHFYSYTMNDLRSPVRDPNGNAPFTNSGSPPPAGWSVNPNNNDCTGLSYTASGWAGPCSWVPTYNQIPWQDPNAYYWIASTTSSLASASGSAHFDGTIIGKPLIEGYIGTSSLASAIGYGWFDFYGTQINYCPLPTGYSCTGPNYIQWTYSNGGTLADLSVNCSGLTGPQLSTFLPQTTTHAVNNYQAHYLCRGASRSANIVDSGIWAVKWAETRMPVPHYNSFRPCASDRVLINETTAQCFTTSSMVMAGNITGLTTGSNVLLAQCPQAGIYSGCSQTSAGAGNYLLHTGSLVSALPSDYSHGLSSYYPNGFAGIVRFPSAWAICGQAPLSTQATGSNTLISFLSPQTNLRTGDYVDLYSNTALTVASHSVYRSTDTNFVISSSYSGAITASLYAQSTGSPTSSWQDTSQKYEFRYGQWFTSNRSPIYNSTGACTQSCLTYTPCSEQVVYISPNGENSGNSQTFWFTDTFQADSYGCIEQLNCEFWMQDPLYQNPFTPSCFVGNLSVSQDNGTCPNDFNDGLGDFTAYIPYPPQVEAVCALPSGSPSLPPGVTIPALTKPQLAGFPSYAGYTFSTFLDPWTVAANIMNVTASCRFNYSWNLI